jgi:hypothetical protein
MTRKRLSELVSIARKKRLKHCLLQLLHAIAKFCVHKMAAEIRLLHGFPISGGQKTAEIRLLHYCTPYRGLCSRAIGFAPGSTYP